MYTIISGTNRTNSNTLKIANQYKSILSELGQESQIFDLQSLTTLQRNADFIALEQQFLIDIKKVIVIIPEYNGSFPGIFKLMMDMCDMKNAWWHKKALLTGLASGRAGNNRGMDHLTNIFNYLKVNVLYNKIPLSQIETVIDENGAFKSEATSTLIKNQLQEFINF